MLLEPRKDFLRTMSRHPHDVPTAPGGSGPATAAPIAAPLHPVFVHFSVALTVVSLLFEILALVWPAAALGPSGLYSLAAATVCTLPTLVTGALSRRHLPLEEGPARAWLRTHMALGPLFFGLLLVLLVWRITLWQHHAMTVGYLALLALAVVLLLIQGYIGGELVYRHGLAVRGRYARLAAVPPESGTPRHLS